MLGGGTKALMLLLATGFIAGFALSSGPTRLLFHAYADPTRGPGEGRDGSAAGGEEGGTGGQRGSVKPDSKIALEMSGGGGSEDGTARTALQDASLADGGDPAAARPGAETLATLLVGNTLQTTQAEQTTIRYLSSKGWVGEQATRNLLVRRWMVQDGKLCVMSELNAAICETLKIAREAKPGRGTGAVLGTVTSAAGVRWTVRRGNVSRIPEMIPLIVGEQSATPEAAPAKPSATGRSAVAAMVGRTLVKASDKAGPLGERYEPDGLWLSAEPLDAAAKTGFGGVRVTLGHWRFVAGLLCVDQPGLDLKTDCAVPEQWGERTFRLRSVRPERVTTMVGVAAL